ncbi:MAG: M67 family metallopeptidase [Nitrospinae bacterium]|nr:M67 family metallopeptidase [Nitrospinota bacterium]
MTDTVAPRPEDLQVMFEHAMREYPFESCGVVIGAPGDPARNAVIPCKNIQRELHERDPQHFRRDADTGYFMDPKDLKNAFTRAAREGLEVVGFYHSHPNHGAYWSAEDHRAAMWADSGEPSYPGAFHIVISVVEGRAREARMFVWDGVSGSFIERAV